MADPLSTAGTAVGITSLGIQVTQALFKYYNDVKDQPSDTSRTLKKLERLRQFFDRLESYLSSRDRDEELADEVIDAVQNCDECIEELQEILEKLEQVPGGSFQASVRATGRRLAYPFKLSTLQKLDEEIDDAISHLSLALSLLQQGAVDQIENDVEDIKAVLATVSASIVSSEIRDWLKAPDATINFNDACAKKHPGTGLWFVKGEEFSNWLKSRGSFLWLKGFAGCGKTVLSSTAIQYARRHQRSQTQIGLCFFYFTFNDETKQDDSAMLRALIIQLMSQLKTTPRFLKDLYDKHKNSMLPVTGLLECLHLLVAMFDDVYVILDALDESPALRARHLMLDTLQSMRDWRNLHLLVTSRELPDISDSLQASQLETIVMKNNVNEDIASFVSEHIRSDTALQKFKKYHARIEQVLTEKAQGVFRWVECQFIAIKQCPRSPYLIEKLLNSLPQTLDETYERMLQNIPSDFMEQAQQMLSILCCAVRPLTAPELIDALAVDAIVPLSTGALPEFDIERRVENIDDLQKICPGFIEVVLEQDTENATIRIAHFSVQEYLESDRIRAHGKAATYMVIPENAHAMMASICLTILLEEGLKDLEVGEIKERYPLVTYAAKGWPHHFRNGKPMVQLDQQTIMLLTNERGSLRASIKIWNLDQLGGGIPKSQWPTALYYASFLGLSSVVKALFQESCDVGGLEGFVTLDVLDMQCGSHGTPLQAAVTKGHLDVVKILLGKGANPNVKFQGPNSWGSYGSPLIAAAGEGHCEIVELLLNAGAKINTRVGLDTAIEEAVGRGRHEIIRMLLKRGSNLEGEALVTASWSGDMETVSLLLDAGFSINAPIPHDDEMSALEAACISGGEGVVQLLLRKGAELTTRMPRGRTREVLSRLKLSEFRDMDGMIRLLIRTFLKEDINNVTFEGRFPTYLEAAVELRDETLLSSLFKMKTEFSNLGEWGLALLEASAQGHVRIAEMLLDMGVDVNFRQQIQKRKVQTRLGTALQNASRYGWEEIVHLILERGGDPNTPGVEYYELGIRTALDEALSNGHIGVAELLLANDAAFNDSIKAEALISASERGHLHIVMFLLDRGADVKFEGEYGTALHEAAANGRKEIVQALLKNGADVHSKGGRYRTALTAASVCGHIDIVKILLEHGAGQDDQNSNASLLAELSTALKSDRQNIVQLLLNEFDDTTTSTATTTYFKEDPEILCNAAKGGYKDVVSWFLNSGVSADATLLYRALQAASEAGQTEIVKTLLGQGANPDFHSESHSKEHMTPLIAATRCGAIDIVQLLLQAGAEINAQAPYRYDSFARATATFVAAKEGETETLQLLLSNGGDPNLEAKTSNGDAIFAIQAATDRGHNDGILLLLEHGANINAHSDKGTALFIASQKGRRDLVELLLQRGADVNIACGEPGTALQVACAAGGHGDMVELLLKHGADVNLQAGGYGTATIAASAEGHLEIVQLLIKQGADINMQAGDYGTAIIAASAEGHLEIVQLLIKQGADINMQAGDYGTAIIAASTKDHLEVVELLLREGANVNSRGSKEFNTAINAASANGHLEVVNLLLREGADVDIHGGHYGTAITAASVGGYLEIIKLLLKRGADLNVQAGKYGTAIIAASAHGHLDVAEILLREGADLNIWGSGKLRTAFGAALSNNHTDIAMLLLENGMSVRAALQLALEARHKGMAKKLLPLVLDVGLQTSENPSNVHLSMVNRFVDICKRIMENNEGSNEDSDEDFVKDSYESYYDDSDEGQNYHGTPLQIAVLEGCKSVVDLILRYGADANGPRWGLGAPLQIAASLGRKDLVTLLLLHGADVNIWHDGRYWPALLGALFERHTEVAELLLEQGADKASDSTDKRTALQIAASEGDVFTAEFLIQHGSDVNASEPWKSWKSRKPGKSWKPWEPENRWAIRPPLYDAVLGGHTDMVALLLDHGADVNARYKHYEGVLSAALEAGHQNIVELLTQRGVGRQKPRRSSV